MKWQPQASGCAAALPREGAPGSKGHKVAHSGPMAARREA